MPLVYATPQDLAEQPENAQSVLLIASLLVRRHTVTAFYRTDEMGMPRDEAVRALFRAATIAQVEFWVAHDIDPVRGAIGVTGSTQVSSKSIGSASVSYDFRAAQDNVASRLASLDSLAPTAAAILEALPRGPVIVHG